MRITLPVTFLSIILFFSCNSPQNDSDIIDYSSLKELSTELVLKIGESEDYIPSRITDIEVTRDGTILVADMGNTTIEQFNSEGKHVGTVARAGRGPGELSNIFDLHLLNGDTLIARNRPGRKDYFAQTENEKFNHINTIVQSNHTMRSLDILKPVTGDKFYGIKNNREARYNDLKDPQTTISEAFIVVDKNENVLNDSVQVLKRRGTFSVELKGGGYIQSSFPFQINEQVVPLEGGTYMITRPDSSAFFVYNENHTLEQQIPVNVKERPVTDKDLEFVSDNKPKEAINLINKMSSDVKPPYNKVHASSNYFWLLTGQSKAGKEVVILDYDGAPVGKFILSGHDYIYHVEDDRFFTVNRDPNRGNQVHVYEIDM